MTGWLGRNAHSIEALAAAATALVAVAALIGVKLQIDANDRIAREQSARDIYRAQLVLAIEHPTYAAPDVCRINAEGRLPAYAAFVEHTIYAAEQMLDLEPDLAGVAAEMIEPHAAYLCTFARLEGYADHTAALIRRVRAPACEPMAMTCLE